MEFWKKLIIYAFLVEISVILIFLILIPLHRLYYNYRKRAQDSLTKQISDLILQCLVDKKSFNLGFRKFKDYKILLSTSESFDYRFNGESWKKLKKNISENYLLPVARKKFNSFSWVKRNFAARCFALNPLKEDEGILLKLINDPVFLVRSVAAIALARLEHRKGIIDIIRQMSLEKGYAHYFYRDLLLGCSDKVFMWIKEIAEEDQNPLIHLACLELLSNKFIGTIPNYLRADSDSKDANTRLAAVKIIARNPQKDSEDLLIKSLNDPDPEIRKEAITGLQYFPSKETFTELENALKDSVWIVRLQAAQILKKMGQKGIDILKNQDQSIDKNAYDAAQTILQFNW